MYLANIPRYGHLYKLTQLLTINDYATCEKPYVYAALRPALLAQNTFSLVLQQALYYIIFA